MKVRWGLVVLGPAALRGPDGASEALERKAAALLAYVAIAGPTPRATLAGLLWPNTVDTSARNNLRQLLHRLRAHDELLAAGSEVRLGSVETDVGELQRLADAERNAELVERWGEPPPVLLEGHDYDDCPDLAEWVAAERERLLDVVRRAQEAEADRLEADGDLRAALRAAQQLSALDPLSESGYLRLMRLHYLAGDRSQALAVFRQCRTMLRDTFGLEPLPDTLALARVIDSGSAPRPRVEEAGRLPVTLLRPPRMAGRERAWDALESAWRRLPCAIVRGEAGIGKTRLLRDFAASRGDALPLPGLPGDRNVPYATVSRALNAALRDRPELAAEPWLQQELSRLLPERFPRPEAQSPIRDEPHKLRLFEAVAVVVDRALEERATLLGEDLHLWDDASFELGTYLLTRLAAGPKRALLSYRVDEFGPERDRSLRRLVEGGLAEVVQLEPLDLEATRALIASTGMPQPVPPAEEVFRVSAGNPFYVLEYLRTAWPSGRDAPEDPLPRSAASVLATRLGRLSRAAADVLRVRAMAGTDFSTALAAAVLELPAETVRAGMDELERCRLLDRGELVHELVADTIEAGTPPTAARLWHRRLAVQLERFGAPSATVAAHYLSAWEPAAAFAPLLAAGDDARAVFALEEAGSWYFRALWAAQAERGRAEALLRLHDVVSQRGRADDAGALLDELDRLVHRLQDPDLLAEVGLRRARWLTLRGDHAAARRLAQATLADTRRAGDTERTERAQLALGDVAYFAGDFAAAHEHFQAVTGSSHDARSLRAFQRLGALEALRGDVDAAFEHHADALTVARRLHDIPSVASLLNSLGADRERRGAYEEAAAHFREAAEVAERAADRRTSAIALSNASLTLVARGALADALAHARRALDAAAPLGADRSLAMAHFAHGYALRRLGQLEPAREALEEAVRLREQASDLRGALVARFNLAALALERARPEQRSAALEAADAVLAELEALNIPQFVAWCRVELAFLDDDGAAAAARVDAALALDRTDHLRLAAAAARLRAGLLAEDAALLRSARGRLLAHLSGPPVQESSVALLLLARAADGDGEDGAAREHLERAAERIALEVGALGPSAAAERRRYVERRVPAPP